MSEKPRCKCTVWGRSLYGENRCEKNATTAAGFCKLHDPEFVRARNEKNQSKWSAKLAREEAEAEARRRSDLQRDADAEVGRALREMANTDSVIRVAKARFGGASAGWEQSVDVRAADILAALAAHGGGA